MKTLSFLFSTALSFVLIGLAYWLLSKLFPWYMVLHGFWYYFLMFWFAFLTYRFFLSNLELFRLRKTILLMVGNSTLSWIRAILLILLSICGCLYVVNFGTLNADYAISELIGYLVFILLTIQLTFSLIFQLLSSGDK